MKKTDNFNDLDLDMLPFDEQTCIIDDEFMAADNLDEHSSIRDLSTDPHMTRFLTAPYPFKLQFSIMNLCMEGCMRVRVNLNEYEMHRNSLMIVPQGTIVQCLNVSSDCRVVIIAFSADYIIPESSPAGTLIVRKFLAQNSMMQLSDDETEEILTLYRAMRAKVRQPSFNYKREALRGYMQVLYYDVCQVMTRYVEKFDTGRSSRKKQIFDQFIQLLQQYCTSERSIVFYAEKLCLTPKYLSQVVRVVSGRHAGEWIRDYVILEAKALLKSQQYSVQQVADMLNFANQSFFGVYFKKAVGCSPSVYQNK